MTRRSMASGDPRGDKVVAGSVHRQGSGQPFTRQRGGVLGAKTAMQPAGWQWLGESNIRLAGALVDT